MKDILSDKRVHIALIIIGIGGLLAGYIFLPALAMLIDLIMCLGGLLISADDDK